MKEPVAWLHEVTADDGEPDQALSFSRESFPLEGVAGYRTVSVRPLYTHPPASGAVTEAKYHELLYAVARAWPNETRHETALRYIREAESHCGPATAALSQGGKP